MFCSAPKVGATVYVLKNHAKYLAKELLVPRGKGSDASNKHDEEAEEEYFSDDQEVDMELKTTPQPRVSISHGPMDSSGDLSFYR